MKIKAAVFPGKLVREGFGKLVAILEYFLTTGLYSCYHAAKEVGGKKP